MKKGFFDNIGLKIFSFLFALILWFFVSGKGKTYTEISYTLPLEFKNIPGSLIVTNDFKDKIEVRLSGPTTLLNSVRSEKLKYTIDLSEIPPGESSFSINPENITLLRGLKITKISPSKITLILERIIKKVVPLKLNMIGTPPEGFEIVSTSLTPKEVTIQGAESEVNRLNLLPTVEVDVSSARENIDRELDILFKDIFYSEILDKKSIRTQIEIVEKTLEKEILGITPVIAGIEGEAYRIMPKNVDVTLSGPYTVIRSISPESLNLTIPAENVTDAPVMKQPVLTLPEGVSVVKIEPEMVEIVKVTTDKKRR